MTKERYREIRKNLNSLWLYYKEEGGIIKDENTFREKLDSWLLMTEGISIRAGGGIILRYLDKKYQYEK